MPLDTGTTIGTYEITAKIGEGGMGKVYQARDTKLDRDVALKVLPEAFTADAERLTRFEREAKVLASLNHPNIAAIHGFEESGDVRALVLELVEGPTLADRIGQGPIPIDDAVPIAKQIAEALEAAHEQGVIHRDLKPANIKVREDGTVKVLDFGLAKALDPSAASATADPSQSPTMTAAATQMGVIMGTAAYMAPEQARGKAVDKRADIWAFGVVLYEMLTGTRLFGGDNVTETLAQVIERTPDIGALAGSGLSRLVGRCLERDPRRRLRDIGDARFELDAPREEPVDDGPRTSVAALPVWQRPVPLSLAVLILAVAATSAVWNLVSSTPSPPAAPTRFPVTTPPGVGLSPESSGLAISPDGQQVVFPGLRGSITGLYHRRLDELAAVEIPGTEYARLPFFSPDGRWLAFGSDSGQTLMRVPLDGGPVETIAALGTSLAGAEWMSDETIIFTKSQSNALWRVPAAGGEPEQITSLETGVRWFDVLPDGTHALATTGSTQASMQIALVSLDTGEIQPLFSGMSPFYAPTGHIMFWRDGAVWATPFSADSRQITGEPVRLIEGVGVSASSQGLAQFAIGDDGTAVYQLGDVATRSLVWVDQDGREEPLDLEPSSYANPRLSADGLRLAVQRLDDTGNDDIWVYDLERGTPTRITSDPAGDNFPLWSPDGARVVFQRMRGDRGLHWTRADGVGEAEQLLSANGPTGAFSWSGDGRQLLYIDREDDISWDIHTLSIDAGHESTPLLQEPYDELRPAVSPDGRWMAYYADETGANEVYVRSFPNVNDIKLPISRGGGSSPLWAPDGSAIYYRNGRAVLRVAVDTASGFTAGLPEVLIDGPYVSDVTNSPRTGRTYDVAPDGRFLMLKEDAGTAQTLVVAQDWLSALD